MPPTTKPKFPLVTKFSVIIILAAVIQISSVFFLSDKILLALISLVVFSVLIAAIFVLLHPLNKILITANLFLQGNFQNPLTVKTSDEIGQLAQIITDFSTHLKTSSGRLTQYQLSLDSEKLKMASIINAVSDGVIALDFNNQVVIQNSTAQKLTGYTNQELEYKALDNFVRFNEKDGIKVDLAMLCNPNHLSQNTLPETLTIVGKNNLQNSVKVQTSQIVSQTANNLKCLLILHDVSKEKALQGIQIDFVSMASHELRTPLTSIIGYLSVFMDENKATFNKVQTEFLDRIMISAKQLNSLIENLLNVSKVERNAFSITTQHVDWQTLLTKMVEDNRLQAAQKNISLTLDTTTFPLPQVLADPIRIAEVLNNIIGNAINYTKEGGNITVGAKTDNKEIVTFVKDTGVGIPQEALAHLFTKFFRVQGALDTSSNSKGTGLGLYLAKSIIDLHHGRIWVESTLNQGSTFYFSLPIVQQQPLPSNLQRIDFQHKSE